MEAKRQSYLPNFGDTVFTEPLILIHKINEIANNDSLSNKKFKSQPLNNHSNKAINQLKQHSKVQPSVKKDFYSEFIPNKSQRKKYVQLKQQLIKKLDMTINYKQGKQMTFILQYSILQGAFNDIIGQIKKQCKDKGDLVEFIWKQTFKLLEDTIQKIIQHTNNEQRAYLRQIIDSHQQYLALLDKNKQQSKQKTNQLQFSHKLLSSLMFGIKDRKKQNKNLSKAVKQLSQQVNNLRQNCTDLQIQNLGYLISNTKTSQEQALLLQLKRQQLKKEKINRVYISTRKQGKKKQETEEKIQDDEFKTLTFSLLNLMRNQSQFPQPIQIEEEANINELLIEDQIQTISLKKGETNKQQNCLSFRKYQWKFIDQAVDTADLHTEKDNIATQFSFSQRAQLYMTKNTSAQTVKQIKKTIQSKEIGFQTEFNIIRRQTLGIKKAYQLSFLFQNSTKVALKLTTIPRNYIANFDNTSYLRSSRIVNRPQKFKNYTIKQQQPHQQIIQKNTRRSTKTNKINQNLLRSSTFSNIRIFKNNKQMIGKTKRPNKQVQDESISIMKSLKFKGQEKKLIKVNSSGQNHEKYCQQQQPIRFASTQSEQFYKNSKGKVHIQFHSAAHTPDNIFLRQINEKEDNVISEWEKLDYSSQQLQQKPDILHDKNSQNGDFHEQISLKLIKVEHKRAATGTTTPALERSKRKPLKSKSIKSIVSIKQKNIKHKTPIQSTHNIPTQFFRRTAPILGSSIIDSTITEYFCKNLKSSGSINPMVLPNKLRVPTKIQLGNLVAKISGTNKVISPQNLYKILNQIYNCAYEMISKQVQVDSFVTPITHYLELNYGKNKKIHFQSKIQHLLAQFYCYRNQHWAFREVLLLLNLLNVENNIPFKQELNHKDQDLTYLQNLNETISAKDTMLFLKLLRRLAVTWNIPLNVIDLYTNQAKISKHLKKILLEQNIKLSIVESIEKDLFEQIKNNIMLKRQQQISYTKKSNPPIRQSVANINVFKCCQFVLQKLGQSRKEQYEYYRSSIDIYSQFSNKKPLQTVYEFCKLLIKLEFLQKIVEINKNYKLMKIQKEFDDIKRVQEYTLQQIFQKYFIKGIFLSLDVLFINGLRKFQANENDQQIQFLCINAYEEIRKNKGNVTADCQAMFEAICQRLSTNKVNQKNLKLFQFRNLLMLNFIEKKATTILEQIIGSDLTCLYCLSSWSLS